MNQPMPGDTLPIALAFLEAHPNWYIFPIRRLEKFPPLFPDNLNLASNDPAQIKLWHKKYLGCNWGVSLKKSGIVMLDVDTKEGKNGQQTLDRLELENGEIPVTLTVQTPNGGLHFYYQEANGVKHRSALGKSGFGDSIDCPNYVVIPGCWLSSGGVYEIIYNAEVADTPAWFADYLKEPDIIESDQTPETDLDDPANVKWYTDYLKYEAPPSVQDRNGDFALLMAAGVGKDRGISQATTIELLIQHYNITAEERLLRNDYERRDAYRANAEGTAMEPNGSYCDPLWGTTDDENSADSLPIKVRNAWAYLKKYRPGSNTPQASFDADDALIADDDESRNIDGSASQSLRAITDQVYSVKAGTVFTLPNGKKYTAKGGSYSYGAPFNPVAEDAKERTNQFKSVEDQEKPLVERQDETPPDFTEAANPVDMRDSLDEPPEEMPDFMAPATPPPPEVFPRSPFAVQGYNEFPDDIPTEFLNEATGRISPKPFTVNQLCNQWVWVTGIERFVNRKNPSIQWKSSQFDSEFNYMADKVASLAKALFKVRDQLRRFKRLTFRPGLPETLGEAYNCWRPSGVSPAEGDTSVWDEHINFLFPDEKDANLVLDWLAWIIQNPTLKPNHALLLTGRYTGTGKSFIARMMEQIVGVSNTQRPKNSSMGGEFNGWLMNCRLCIIEEVMQTNRRENINAMRDLITEPRIEVNIKGIPAFVIDNTAAVMGISNHSDALPLDNTDRRWLVVETKVSRRDKAYYTRLMGLLDNPTAIAAIAYQLATRKVATDYGLGAAPETEAKTRMVEHSRSDAETWLLENIGNPPFVVNGVARTLISVQEIIDAMPAHYQKEKGLPRVTVPNFLEYGRAIVTANFRPGRKLAPQRIDGSQRTLWCLDGTVRSPEMIDQQYRKERRGVKEVAKAESEMDGFGAE
jgi:Bifunctional DNA primase/polymerase, N-terminal/Family of unknown function (DUF5906)